MSGNLGQGLQIPKRYDQSHELSYLGVFIMNKAYGMVLGCLETCMMHLVEFYSGLGLKFAKNRRLLGEKVCARMSGAHHDRY